MKINSLLISMLFLVITLANSLKIASTIGYYALFTEDFVERFCENKDKPELQCDGKCELAKMLLKQAKDKTPPINIDFLKNETVLFLTQNLMIDFSENNQEVFVNQWYTNLYNFSYTESLIHPPQA